jgi:ABC-type branched-subunit amino acid transport system substrate-binding protein
VTRTIAVLLLAGVALAQEPYKDARKNPPTFAGPGANDPEPAGLTEVRIGWFGPSEGPMWEAANRAIAGAGTYKGLPFRLVPGWAADPWRAGAAHLTRMVFRERVWAIVAAANGDAVHLAEQVATKALLTVMNPAATDRSIHTAGVPWAFSCVQGDHAIAPALAGQVKGSAVLVSSTDHDSRAFVAELKPLLRIARHVEFEPGRAEAAARAAGPEPVVVVANTQDTGAAVEALRAAGHSGRILGGPRATNIERPLIAAPDACAYDSVNMLVAAVRKAGLNRERIREAVKSLSPYDGASGRIEWDEFGQNRSAVGWIGSPASRH